MSIEVQVNQRQMNKALAPLRQFPNVIKKVMKESINRTAAKTKTRIEKALTNLTGLKKKDIKKNVNVRKATKTNLSATVSTFGSGIPLIKFTKKGRLANVIIQTTQKQSMYLFFNVFQPMFGPDAVFAETYRIKQKRYKTITVNTGGGSEQIQTDEDNFVATMPSGHVGVFERDGDKIHEKRGPSPGQLLAEGGILVQRIQNDASKDLISDISKRVQRFLTTARKVGA